MNKTYRTIIIDDEKPARIRLKTLLAGYNVINIIAEAKDGIEAVNLIDAEKPDLIFLDIKMPGLSGFEVLQKIRHSPYVIFCTAFDDFALQAFETKSVDYLLKPVEKSKLDRAVSKLKEFTPTSLNTELSEMIQEMITSKQSSEVSSLPIKKSDRVIFLKLSEITHFKASEKYVEVNTHRGDKHLTDQSLRFLETKLPKQFIRINRACIINTTKIKEVRKHFSGKYVFILDDLDQTNITSGRSYNHLAKSIFEL